MQFPGAANPQQRVNIIVWTYNDGPFIDATLLSVFQQTQAAQAVVVDGGSTDDTPGRVTRAGVKVLSLPLSRHRQLRAAVSDSRSDVLLFVHASAELPGDAVERIRKAMADPAVLAGELQFRYRPGAGLTWLGRTLGLLGLFRNETAFFVWRNAYESVGGFRESHGLEEVDLIMRLQRHGKYIKLTSECVMRPHRRDRRYQRLISQAFYWIGWPPCLIGIHRTHQRGRKGRFNAPARPARSVPSPGQIVGRHSTTA